MNNKINKSVRIASFPRQSASSLRQSARSAKRNEGFTLIEMLVVVSVIAILSGITLTGISAFTSRARDTQRIGDLRNIQPNLELFFNKCGHYPGLSSATGDCDLDMTSWQTFSAGMETAVGARLPNDPLPNRNYYYAYEPDAGFEYILGTKLENDNNVLRNDITEITGFTPITDTPAMTCDSDDPSLQYCIGS